MVNVKWAGKTAVVTGASAGIGAAVALALAHKGVDVVAAARREDKLEELKKKFESEKKKENKALIHPFVCDMSKQKDIESLMSFAKDLNGDGGIDILVNNAAILPTGTIAGVSMDKITECYMINVVGVIAATKLAAADMVAKKIKGHIIMINSISGHKTVTTGDLSNTSVYSSSKHALTELVENFRLEFNYTRANIRVTSISPGAVDTEMLRSVQYSGALPMLKPRDIADAVVYALSVPDTVNITEMTIQAVGEVL
ncbi:farnesol dehydrogenase isoform X1 [Plutella xylostella]|uniref:farnesol dehydrogenase isoform X1 n=1 Tax=Plutella xylostella TaxID=51655 RepID=UPI00203309C5|nr:farnesol dehydrogenase isoform X1 [Plutella xylostella]